MSIKDLLLARPACCAAAAFSAVSFLGYFAAADADPALAGTVKLIAAALFFIASLALTLLAARAGGGARGFSSGGQKIKDSKGGAAPGRRLYASAAALLFACALAAVISWLQFGRPARLLEKYSGGAHDVTITALEARRVSSYDAAYYVKVEKIDGRPLVIGNTYALLEAEYILDIELYKVYTIPNITISAPEYATLQEAAYDASRGVMIVLRSAEEAKAASLVPQGEGARLRAFFTRLNTALSQRFAMSLGKDSGGFAACLLLGRWDYLTGTIPRDFRALGILHLLAISGEHLSVLLGALDMLLRGLNKYMRYALLCIGALVIFALTGFSPAVARASLMAVLYYGAFLLGRSADAPTSLSLAVALILLFSPAAAADVGLIMSALATLGIMAAGNLRLAGKVIKPLAFLYENLINSIYATIFTLPASWLITGELSLIGPLMTLVFSLPVAALLYILPLVLLLFGTPVSEPLNLLADALCKLVRVLAQTLATPLYGAVVSLRYPFVFIAFAAGIAAALTVSRIKLKSARKAGILAFAAAFAVVYAVMFGAWSAAGAYSAKVIYYSGSSKNDMLVIGSEGAVVICDISDGTYTPPKNAARLARARLFATKVDGYLLTHLHRRHTMQYMRIASRYFINTLILPKPVNEDEGYAARALEEAAKEYGSRVIYYDASEDSEVRMRSLQLLLPARHYIKRSTHPAIALYVSGRGVELLYLGGGNGEALKGREELLSSLARSAKCIVFGKHSPAYYSLADPMPFSQPKLAVYPSNEVKEAYGIPHSVGTETLVLSELGHDFIELVFRER